MRPDARGTARVPARASARSEALATDPIGRLLWWSCSQTTVSVGVFGIYALTNAWFVARGVGETALAAVNVVAPLLLLLGAVSTTVGVGGASLVSRRLGAGRPDAAARAAGTSFTIFWGAALATSVIGLAALDPLLRLVGATAEMLPYARPYAQVLIAGAVLSTGFSSIVRAEGRLLFSTMLWIIPVVVQIVLDPLLILGAGMGVTGAALGTLGGQAVSASMALWFFFVQRDRPYRIRPAHLVPDPADAREIVAIGAPSFLAGIGTTLLAILVNTALAAAGAAFLAAYAVCARVQTFIAMPQTGIAQGMQPIVGFNAGRGLAARVARVRRLSLRASVVYGGASALLIALAAPMLVGLFVTDPAVVGTAVHALRILAIGMAVAGIAPVAAAYCQAFGRPRAAFAISLGTLVLIRVPLVLLGGAAGPLGVWVALAAGEVVSAAVALVILRRV